MKTLGYFINCFNWAHFRRRLYNDPDDTKLLERQYDNWGHQWGGFGNFMFNNNPRGGGRGRRENNNNINNNYANDNDDDNANNNNIGHDFDW